MAGKLLEVGKLCKNFGGLATLSDVDLCVEEGEIRGLIGSGDPVIENPNQLVLFKLLVAVVDRTPN